MKLLFLILAGVCLVVSISMNAEAKPFKTNSYTVNLPNGCKTDAEENRFSDDANFNCKTYGFAFEMAGAPFTGTDEEMPDQLLTVIQDKWGASVEEVERGTDKYTFNNQTAPYVQATYDQEFHTLFGLPGDTQKWAYMVVGIKMGDDVLYAQYKNDISHFDKQLSIFEKVLKSIKAQAGSVNETETDNSFTSRGDDFSKTRALCDTVTTQSAKDLCGTLLS